MKRVHDINTRIWKSIAKPRVLSVIMIFIYSFLGMAGLLVIDHYDGSTSIFAGIFLMLSAIIGIPSAWRGSYWSEYFGAVAGIIGLIIISVIRIDILIKVGESPIYSILMIASLILFFFQRAIRIHPKTYASFTGKESEEDRLKRHASEAIDKYNKVLTQKQQSS